MYIYKLVISRAEYGRKSTEHSGEQRGEGERDNSYGCDRIQGRSSCRQSMRFEAQCKGGASKHRTISAETDIRGEGDEEKLEKSSQLNTHTLLSYKMLFVCLHVWSH